MKLRVIAVTVMVALIGGLFAGSGVASGRSGGRTDTFHLRTAADAPAPCTFFGQVTTCTIDVTKLKRAGEVVMASGTVTPLGAPAIKFKAPVEGFTNAGSTVTGSVGRSVPHQVPALPSCDILNLVLGPLHLDLLGLVVDLNQVILEITGQTGAGNLLGNLLCALFGLLDGPAVISQFVQALTNLLAAINAVLAL
jgi:hypothetical protein